MIERRFIEGESLEVEERSGSAPKIRGRAIVYNSPSRDLGGFREVIEPGAFDHILARQRPRLDVVALFNHDASQLLGRSSAGTLKLWSDDRGVVYEIDPLPNTALARDLLEHIRLKNIVGSSFAFSVGEGGERYDVDDAGQVTRYISRAEGLFDVSPVTQPAYESSAVSVRSFEEWRSGLAAAVETPAPAVSKSADVRFRHFVARAKAILSRAVLVLAFVGLVCGVAEARPRRGRSSGYNAAPAGGDTSTAQGVAEIMARTGHMGHYGGNSGYEGVGMAATPEAALANRCYSRSGMAVVDQGVARGANGMWFACKRYR